ESPRLMGPSLVVMGKIEGLTGDLGRVLGSVGQEISLAQVDGRETLGVDTSSHRAGLLDRLLEEWQALVETPGQDVRIAQMLIESEDGSEAPGPAELTTALEEADRLVEIALAQVKKPRIEVRDHETEWVIHRLGNPHGFLRPGCRRGELSPLGKR